MSKLEAKEFTTLVGRLVGGSVSEPITEDFDGNALTVKTGKNKGKETQRFSFGVAFPKNGLHWAHAGGLGPIVWEVGNTQMGAAAQREDFSWKVTDGDSTKPNKKQNKPCDNEGFPGHWVFWFSSSFAPDTFDATGENAIDPELIKRGYYVQVRGSVVGNENDSNPGVFINHGMVALAGYGAEIVSKNKPDPKKAGFGVGVTLPAGASATPVGGMPSGASPPPPKPATPPPPAAPAPTLGAPAVPAAPAPVAVAPAPSFIAPPAAPAAPTPAAPPPPAAPAGPVMTAKANGASYESFKANGWTDETMRANGYLA